MRLSGAVFTVNNNRIIGDMVLMRDLADSAKGKLVSRACNEIIKPKALPRCGFSRGGHIIVGYRLTMC